MKITRDIDDELLARAEAAAERDETTLDALVKQALTFVLTQANCRSIDESGLDAKPS